MPEMITVADRIVVMDDYRIKGELANSRRYTRMGEGIMALIHARGVRPSEIQGGEGLDHRPMARSQPE